ncbi:hypothetical protein SAMN05216532_0121 [Streptomyces sp. 2231.1]|uniref:hypothetical protein n=1 Tax=Streptomyces sp. 2231.1 TaxID=1855347 RepID=UPI0008989CB1|nr:hypothetical protein [Streptomyces sp. 2231.1]SEB98974.1 hypothetical protein SAMN05216532_0121 [Streptomyces sp. 2231.1]
MIAAAIRWAREEHVAFLLDYSAERWQRVLGPYQRRGSGGYDKRVAVFLLYARDAVETLHDGSGWESSTPGTCGRLGKRTGLNRSVSRPRPRSELRFDRITQPWLRALAKRWIRLRRHRPGPAGALPGLADRPPWRAQLVNGLRLLFQAIRHHGWDNSLPAPRSSLATARGAAHGSPATWPSTS